jgi:hypothetical protein
MLTLLANVTTAEEGDIKLHPSMLIERARFSEFLHGISRQIGKALE